MHLLGDVRTREVHDDPLPLAVHYFVLFLFFYVVFFFWGGREEKEMDGDFTLSRGRKRGRKNAGFTFRGR